MSLDRMIRRIPLFRVREDTQCGQKIAGSETPVSNRRFNLMFYSSSMLWQENFFRLARS
jgi:hypothetical protein